jgi:hypothetical protein
MRLTGRCAALIGTVALALALAVATPSAVAQAVELTDEQTAEHCPSVSLIAGVVSGGCSIHLVTDQPLTFYSHPPGGVEFPGAACDLELVVALDEQGQGYVTDAVFVPAFTAECNWEPCPTYDPLPWPIGLSEVDGSARMSADLCLFELWSGAVLTCPFDGTVVDLSGHLYQVTLDSTGCVVVSGGQQYPYPIELDAGRLVSESGDTQYDAVEIVHL